MTGSIVRSIILLIGIAALFALAFMSMPRLDRYLDLRSIEACSTLSSYSQDVDENTNVAYPVQDVYESCLQTLEVK